MKKPLSKTTALTLAATVLFLAPGSARSQSLEESAPCTAEYHYYPVAGAPHLPDASTTPINWIPFLVALFGFETKPDCS